MLKEEKHMRRTPTKILVTAAMLILGIAFSRPGSTKPLDLSVARFIECSNGGSDCRAHNDAYEKFMAEYSFGISPKLMSPASTLGYSGFYLGIETSLAAVPSSGTDAFERTNGNYDEARWRIGTAEFNAAPERMFFPTIHVRKGLPWSFEVGSSISYLAKSELIALGGEIKWSLFEGYKDGVLGALPDVAVRGTVNRVIGQSDVDMTLVGVDGSVSRPFGIAGVMSIEPYAGYQFIWSIIRTEPMALYNETGALMPSGLSLYDAAEANLSGPNLTRQKIFAGFLFRYEMLAVTMDWTVGLPAKWTTEQYPDFLAAPADSANLSMQKVDVKTSAQIAWSLGVGVQF
jgi:hypothetical protein